MQQNHRLLPDTCRLRWPARDHILSLYTALGLPSIFGRLFKPTLTVTARSFNQPFRGSPRPRGQTTAGVVPGVPFTNSDLISGRTPPTREGWLKALAVLFRGSHGGFGRSMVRFLGGCRSLSNCFQRDFSSKSDLLFLWGRRGWGVVERALWSET